MTRDEESGKEDLAAGEAGSNEELCARAQGGDVNALICLIQQNLGYIKKKSMEVYDRHRLDQSACAIDVDDLFQEGCIGMLKAVIRFDASKGYKFLTYANMAIVSTMIDLIRKEAPESMMTDREADIEIVRMEDLLSEEQRGDLISAQLDPYSQSPERIAIKAEDLRDLYTALSALSARERSYLLFRFGFTSDDMIHPLSKTASHFHLSESSARRTERSALKNLGDNLRRNQRGTHSTGSPQSKPEHSDPPTGGDKDKPPQK